MRLRQFMQPNVRHLVSTFSRDKSLSQAGFLSNLNEQRSLTASNTNGQPGAQSTPASVSGPVANRCELTGRVARRQSEVVGRRVGRLDALPSHWICWCLLAARDETTSRPNGLLLRTGSLNGCRPQQFTRASRRRCRRETPRPSGCGANSSVTKGHPAAPWAHVRAPHHDARPCRRRQRHAVVTIIPRSLAPASWHSTRAAGSGGGRWGDRFAPSPSSGSGLPAVPHGASLASGGPKAQRRITTLSGRHSCDGHELQRHGCHWGS